MPKQAKEPAIQNGNGREAQVLNYRALRSRVSSSRTRLGQETSRNCRSPTTGGSEEAGFPGSSGSGVKPSLSLHREGRTPKIFTWRHRRFRTQMGAATVGHQFPSFLPQQQSLASPMQLKDWFSAFGAGASCWQVSKSMGGSQRAAYRKDERDVRRGGCWVCPPALPCLSAWNVGCNSWSSSHHLVP